MKSAYQPFKLDPTATFGAKFRAGALRRPVRLGVVGAGWISGQYHLPSIADLAKRRPDLVEFTALAEMDPERRSKAKKAFKPLAVYEDLTTMLREAKLDCVEVIVKVTATKSVSIQCLKAGLPILLEKPPGKTVAEARAIIAASKRTKMPAMVAFNRRWTPLLREAKAAVAGEKLLHVQCQFFRHGRQDEDFFSETGIHGLDALRFLAGDVKEVNFERVKLVKHLKPICQARLVFQSGARGIFSGYPQSGCQVERYTLVTENRAVFVQLPVGWLVDKPGLIQVFHKNKLVHQAQGKPAGTSQVDLAQGGGFYYEIEAFLEGVKAGRVVGPQVAETVQSVIVGQALQHGPSGVRTKV
ncbi:MAG TPA: Gfo/Idh/MocA family oxidoreductase [Planctomycetota bacterium]|nr:Gfo/Idh/MocA family oxidoreductase [Planctomycetota bacterium]